MIIIQNKHHTDLKYPNKILFENNPFRKMDLYILHYDTTIEYGFVRTFRSSSISVERKITHPDYGGKLRYIRKKYIRRTVSE